MKRLLPLMLVFIGALSYMSSFHRSLYSHYSRPHNNELPISAMSSASVLLGIFSMTSDEAAVRRELIRNTYTQHDPRICSLEEYKKQMLRIHQERVCQVPYTFIIGAGGDERPTEHNDNSPLTIETDKEGNLEPDCTYLNIKENMEDGKSATYLKFAASVAEDYNIDYVSKIDDDTILGVKLFLQFINEDLPPSPYNRRIYGGSFVPSYERNQIYAQGQFYFLSTDLVDYVAHTLTEKTRKELAVGFEDLDMGTFVTSHPRPIKMVDLQSHTFWIHPKKEEIEFRKSLDNQLWRLPWRFESAIRWNFYCPRWLKGIGV